MKVSEVRIRPCPSSSIFFMLRLPFFTMFRTKVSLLIKTCIRFLRREVVPIPNNHDSESCYSIWYTFFYGQLVILKICLSCLIVHICDQDCFGTVTVDFTFLTDFFHFRGNVCSNSRSVLTAYLFQR